MADRVIDILIKVKDDGSPALTKFGSALLKTAGIAGAAFTKMAVDAAPLKGIQDAFKGIAESSGVSADAMLDALKRGSAGMVSQRDLMMTYNSAAQLVGNTFANQLPDAMQYLGKVSLATGQDMGFMLDSLVKGVGRLSPMILDNLGVQVSLAEATARASEMFGVQADQLSKAQLQAGMTNVVLEKLRENTAAMPDVVGSAAQQTAMFSAKLADLKDKAGLMALPALTAVLGVVNDLSDSTLGLVIGVGSAAAAIVKFSGGLGPLADMLGTTKMGLGAVGLAVGTMILAWEKYQDVQAEITEGQKQVNEALGAWGQEATVALDAGTPLSAVMSDLGDRADKTSRALHQSGGPIVAVAAAMVRASSEGEIWAGVHTQVGKVAFDNTKTFESYTAALTVFNRETRDGQARLKGMTKETWLLRDAVRDSQLAWAYLLPSQQEHKTAMMGQIAATQGMTWAEIEAATAQEQAAEAARQRLQVTEQLAAAEELAAFTMRDEMLALEGLSAAETRGADVRAAAAEKTAAAALGYEQQVAVQEKAARVADMQAASAQRAAEGLAAQAAAADEAARAQGALMTSLVGATDEMVKQKVFAMIDPAEIGVETYAALGVELGVMDEKSALLATSIPQFVSAVEGGVVPIQNADEALSALIVAAEKGDPAVGAILDQFAKAPGLIGPSAERMENLNARLEKTGEVGPQAEAGMVVFAGAVTSATGPVSYLADELERANAAAARLGSVTGPGGGGVPEYQLGGRVPGYPWETQLAILHGGEQVIPAGQTSMGGTIVIQGPLVESAVIRDERDVELLAELVTQRLAERVRARGAWG